MAGEAAVGWLDRPFDPETDHYLGPVDAEIVLVEYGSYACSHCGAAHRRLAQLRDEFGDRLLYVFRHRPLQASEIALDAAMLAESATTERQFWKIHVELMNRYADLDRVDLREIANEFAIGPASEKEAHEATRRIDRDVESAKAGGAVVSPTFFINGRRYDGPWDDGAFS